MQNVYEYTLHVAIHRHIAPSVPAGAKKLYTNSQLNIAFSIPHKTLQFFKLAIFTTLSMLLHTDTYTRLFFLPMTGIRFYFFTDSLFTINLFYIVYNNHTIILVLLSSFLLTIPISSGFLRISSLLEPILLGCVCIFAFCFVSDSCLKQSLFFLKLNICTLSLYVHQFSESIACFGLTKLPTSLFHILIELQVVPRKKLEKDYHIFAAQLQFCAILLRWRKR